MRKQRDTVDSRSGLLPLGAPNTCSKATLGGGQLYADMYMVTFSPVPKGIRSLSPFPRGKGQSRILKGF